MTRKKSKEKPKSDEAKTPKLKEKKAEQQATGTFGGAEVAYTVEAATQVFEVNEKKVSFFHVSYTKDEADPATRPLVFCFNGGPGSSTVWLHLGVFGPKRMEFDDDGFKVGMQGELADNAHSLLDVADLVFVDALGTGFSTTAKKEDEKAFHHFKQDIEAFSQFIVHYLNRKARWASPKYLAGESYGTLRGAGIARELFSNYSVEFNGIILVSSILNYQTVKVDIATYLFHPGNDLPFALYLPTYAATAWYHKQLPEKYQSMGLRDFLDEVEEFALGEYWTALAKGDRIGDEEKAAITSRLAEYTGLSPDYIDHYDNRLHIVRFCKELLRDQRRTVGRLDSRFLGIDRVSAGDVIEVDPAGDASMAVAASTLNHYLREDIGFDSKEIYRILEMNVWKQWDYEDFKGAYVDTSENMREVLSRSKGTKVFVANGYYDLATPHFATEYTFSHMGLDPEIRANVRMEYYEAGHMMYMHKPSLEALAGHLREFIQETQ
jgi:carboxypeptidase C (cathepsin A)